MMALLRRDLRVLLWTPAGLALVAVWLFLAGTLFMTELFAFEQAEQRALAINDPAILGLLDVNDLLMASVMNNLIVVLLFLGPLMALRLWSDGTARDWTLQRAPSTLAFVLARTGAGAVTVSVLVGLTLLFPMFLAVVGRPAVGDVGVVVDIGQTLLSAFIVAVGGTTFIVLSSVAAVIVDQALAGALVAFVALMVVWLLPSASPLLGPELGPMLEHLSPSMHLEPALRGVVDVGDLVWWLTVNIAGIVGVAGVVDARRR